MRKRLLNDNQITKIAQQIRDGKTLELICLNWKVNMQLLRVSMRRAGHADLVKPTKPNSKRISDEVLNQALTLIAEGWSQRETAKRIGFSHNSLNARIRGRTRGPRNQGKKEKERPQEVINSRLERHISINNAYLSTLQLRVSL